MNEQDKIKQLRVGIMCAVIQLFHSNPEDVLDAFSLEDLDEIAKETDHLSDEKLEGIYKDLLDLTKK